MGRRLVVCALALLGGCATAVDSFPAGPSDGSVSDTSSFDGPRAESSAQDTGARDSDSTVVSDADSASDPDTGIGDSGDPDTGDPDTGTDPDTGIDPDTGTFPVDTGPTGGTPCVYCSSGTCATPISDYSCLLNCLLDGFTDCKWDAAKSPSCTCVP